jgi:hypothetical protein
MRRLLDALAYAAGRLGDHLLGPTWDETNQLPALRRALTKGAPR